MLGPDRCRVLTTNFDALFEDALLRHKPTASIKSRSVAKKQPKSPGTYDVLHLHGILRPGSPGEGPIVLTESQFLEHGPRVRDIVQTALERTQVIFVGVSLTDPNLVAPLWRLSNEKKPYKRPYVVTVAAGHTKSAEPKDARAFVIKKSTYLEEKLNVGTIFLKSYAQIPQLFQELALAKADSDQYFSTDSKTSNRYGYRLKRVLDTAYKNIGCAASEDLPVGQDAAALSHNLHEHLYKSDGGLVAELRDIGHGLKSSNNRKLQDLSSRYGSDLDKEHFGLFLWLRSRRAGARRAEYDLRLVGTSVFTHTEAWSLDRVADIVTTSRHDSANAAFLGRLHIQDLDEGREFQLWRTGLAVPFTVTGASSSLSLPDTGLKLDVLSVGVMTLHSSNSIRRQADGTVARPASILGLLQPDQMNELQTRLGEIARDVLGLWI